MYVCIYIYTHIRIQLLKPESLKATMLPTLPSGMSRSTPLHVTFWPRLKPEACMREK